MPSPLKSHKGKLVYKRKGKPKTKRANKIIVGGKYHQRWSRHLDSKRKAKKRTTHTREQWHTSDLHPRSRKSF